MTAGGVYSHTSPQTEATLLPGPRPARVTVLAVATVWLTGLPKPAVGTLLPTALAKGARWAGLVAPSPVPARFARLTVSRVWRAGLLLLAVAAAVTTLQAIAAGGTEQLTARASEAGWAGALARGGAAVAAQALASLPALGTPPARPAGAAAGVLHAGRAVTGAAEAAAATPPARLTQTEAISLLTARCCWVALAWAATRGGPPARVAAARACGGVAMSVGAAGARKLTVGPPVVGLALALAGDWLTLAMHMAGAALTAVGAPVLLGAAGAALGPKESGFAATQAWLHTHFAFLAGVQALTDS